MARYDAGYPYDVMILDNSSNDYAHLKLLENLSKKHEVVVRPNIGRAQGAYQHAKEMRGDYLYYFFLHDDSSVIRNNWLKVGIDRIHDKSLESLPALEEYRKFPVGKVGYQSYEWGTIDKYLRTGAPAIFRFMKEPAKNWYTPPHFQHSNDDRILLTNNFARNSRIWDISYFKAFFRDQREHSNLLRIPNHQGEEWEEMQTACEFLNDTTPMLLGYRTHNLIGDGYSQEELGWSSFWGNEYVAHFGSHNVFKRLALLLKTTEEIVRSRYKDPSFLQICATVIRRETQCQLSLKF